MIVVMRIYSQMKTPKLTTEMTKTLREREITPDRAMQTLDSEGCQNGKISLVLSL